MCDDLPPVDGRQPFVAVGACEVVAEPREVQGDLVGDLGRTGSANGGVEVPAGPVFDRVGRGEPADRNRFITSVASGAVSIDRTSARVSGGGSANRTSSTSNRCSCTSGLAIAAEYVARGSHVVATVRGERRTALNDLHERSEGRLEIERVDITAPDQVQALRRRLGGRMFDLLFVNAGITNGPDETSAKAESHATAARAGGDHARSTAVLHRPPVPAADQ